jgi:hypothetical protein
VVPKSSVRNTPYVIDNLLFMSINRSRISGEKGKEQGLKRNSLDSRHAFVTLALVLLAAILAFTFVTQLVPTREPQSSQEATRGALSTSVTKSAAIDTTSAFLEAHSSPVVVEAVLSNDQDHDGNYDGMADPLLVLVTSLVLLGGFLVLVVPLVGRPLLRLCESPALIGSDYRTTLERPG